MHRAQAWVTRSIAWPVAGARQRMRRHAERRIASDQRSQRADQSRASSRRTRRCSAQPSQVVKAVTPGPIHDRLHDLNANLKEPRIFANDILQVRFDAAVKTAGRFIMQFDLWHRWPVRYCRPRGACRSRPAISARPCSSGASPRVPTWCGPIYGPSTLRDSVGHASISLADPVGWALGGGIGWPPAIATGSLDATVRLRELKEAEDASIDFYSFLRSDYYQTRRADLREAIGLPAEVAVAGDHLARPRRGWTLRGDLGGGPPNEFGPLALWTQLASSSLRRSR